MVLQLKMQQICQAKPQLVLDLDGEKNEHIWKHFACMFRNMCDFVTLMMAGKRSPGKIWRELS